jgi:hypothetical protein
VRAPDEFAHKSGAAGELFSSRDLIALLCCEVLKQAPDLLAAEPLPDCIPLGKVHAENTGLFLRHKGRSALCGEGEAVNGGHGLERGFLHELPGSQSVAAESLERCGVLCVCACVCVRVCDVCVCVCVCVCVRQCMRLRRSFIFATFLTESLAMMISLMASLISALRHGASRW